MASSSSTSWQIDGETIETVSDFIFLGSKITADGDCRNEIKRYLLFWRKVMTHVDSILKSRDITLYQQNYIYGFSSSHVLMWELDHKEGWVPKKDWVPTKWCFRTVMSGSKEIKLVNPEGNLSWIITGRTDAETEAPTLRPPDGKSQLLEKTLMLEKIEGRRRRGQQRMSWLDGIP